VMGAGAKACGRAACERGTCLSWRLCWWAAAGQLHVHALPPQRTQHFLAHCEAHAPQRSGSRRQVPALIRPAGPQQLLGSFCQQACTQNQRSWFRRWCEDSRWQTLPACRPGGR